MDMTDFIILILVVAVVYNSAIGYIYFREDIKKRLFGAPAAKKVQKVQTGQGTGKVQNRSLVGATRENDWDILEIADNRDLADTTRDGKAASEEITIDGDNSFSTEEIESAMENLNRAIVDERETAEFGTDLFEQISRSGNLKIDIKKGGRTIEKDMMVLANTIVI